MLTPAQVEFVKLGTDDWVPFAAMIGIEERLGSRDPMTDSITELVSLYENGLGTPGIYENGPGFVPWTGTADEIRTQFEQHFETAPNDRRLEATMHLMVEIDPAGLALLSD